MDSLQALTSKRIAVLAADGFEQSELQKPVAALKDAGAEVEVVALRAGRIRGMNVHQSGELQRVDTTLAEAMPTDYDALLVPGGYISPDQLRQSAAVRAFIRQMHELGKPVALMSQAALLLVSCGLAAGRTLTSWPGVRDDMVNAGATWLNQATVRHDGCLTSRGPQDIAAFIQALLPFYAGVPDTASRQDAVSDPPQQEPSEHPDQPLRWLSAPSVGAMLSLALLGVGVVAANRGMRKKQAAGSDATDGAADAS